MSTALTATFRLQEFKLHKIDDAGPATTSTITTEDVLHWYRQAQTIRRMETAAADLYKTKFVRGFCHLYSGQVSMRTNVL